MEERNEVKTIAFITDREPGEVWQVLGEGDISEKWKVNKMLVPTFRNKDV